MSQPPPPRGYWAPSSPGDLADRWTILKLKALKAPDDARRDVALRRLQELSVPAFDDTAAAVVAALGRVNERLWELEDEVRRLAARPEDVDEFVRAARCIPILNDTRAHLKARLDELAGLAEPQDVKMYRR